MPRRVRRGAAGLVLFLSLSAWASPPVPLSGEWSYRPDDGIEGEEGWMPLLALGMPERPSPDGVIRMRLPVPEGDWGDPAVLLGGVSGAVEAFADGRLLYRGGEIRPGGQERLERLAWHLIPSPASVPGGTLELRIQAAGRTAGVQREALVGDRADLLERAFRRGIDALAVGAALVLAALVSLVWFLFRRRSRTPLALGGLALVCGALTATTSDAAPLVWADASVPYRVLLLSLAFFPLALFSALRLHVPAVDRPWMRWSLGASGVLGGSGLLLVLFGPWHAPWLVDPLMVPGFVALVSAVVAAGRQALRGDADARLLSLGFAVLFLCAGWDALGMGAGGGLATHWGVFGLLLAFGGIVGRRAAAEAGALEHKTRQLEARRDEGLSFSRRLALGADELAPVMDALRVSSEAQSRGAAAQTASLQETQVTAEEIRATSEAAAAKAAELLAAAERSAQAGREGEAAVARGLDAIQSVGEEVGAMTERIAAAGLRTREVAQIVASVKALADQSRMLAMNAAVEAVRSGQAGAGFETVAREMRRLADESVRATARIAGTLEGLSSSIEEAVSMSARGRERVGAILERVFVSGEQLRVLSALAARTHETVQQIAAVSAQQSAGIAQIFEAVDALAEQMQQTLERANETERIAAQVREVVARMRARRGTAVAPEPLWSMPASAPEPARG